MEEVFPATKIATTKQVADYELTNRSLEAEKMPDTEGSGPVKKVRLHRGLIGLVVNRNGMAYQLASVTRVPIRSNQDLEAPLEEADCKISETCSQHA